MFIILMNGQEMTGTYNTREEARRMANTYKRSDRNHGTKTDYKVKEKK